jgi:hypothetical protein
MWPAAIEETVADSAWHWNPVGHDRADRRRLCHAGPQEPEQDGFIAASQHDSHQMSIKRAQ